MSITLSGMPGFLVRRMSEQMRERLTPAMACSTTIRLRASRLSGFSSTRVSHPNSDYRSGEIQRKLFNANKLR